MSRASAALASACLVLAPPASAGPAPERVGPWTVTPGPAQPGAGCSMTGGGARGRLLVTLADGEVGMEAASKGWFASGSMTYPVHLSVDGGVPIDVAAEGAGPDGLHILPNGKLAGAALVETLKTARSLAIRKEGNPLVETVAYDLAGFGAAYARLQACAADAAARADTARAASIRRCDALADAVAAAVGGKRGTQDDGSIPVAGAADAVTVFCAEAGGAPSVSLSRNGPGVPAGTRATVDRLAGAVAGRPVGAFTNLSDRCFERATRYEIRHTGKRFHHPEGTTAQREGELKAGPVRLTCRAWEPGQVEPSFLLETE